MAAVQRAHAASADTEEPPALPEDEVKTELARLNPLRNALDDLPAPVVGAEGLAAPEKDEIIFLIRGLQVRCTSGWSGWSNRLLKRVVLDCKDSELLIGAITGFYARWLNGTLGSGAAELFAVGRAVLIPKQGGGVRPLGIGDPWYRLGAQLAVLRVKDVVSTELCPLQLGGGTSSGCEMAARVMQIALDRDHGGELDVCLFSLDIRNAFNSIRRSHILRGIREHCPSLEPFFRLFYGSATELRLSNGAPAAISGTGVRQGDPLAMALFALGFHEALRKLQAAHRRALDAVIASDGHGEGHIIAYADDVGGSLPAGAMSRFCQEAIETLAEFDLHVVPAKCAIFGRLADTIPASPFPVVEAGLRKFLGCPIGDVAFRAEIAASTLTNMTACIPTLLPLGSYTAYTLLTSCINQRAQYLTRILELPNINDQLAPFDADIDSALSSIMDCDAQDHGLMCAIRCLPKRMGGLGAPRHSGPEGDYNRNASRNATLNYIRTSGLPRTFYNQLQDSWYELALGWGGTETTHTMDEKDAREAMVDAQKELHQRLYEHQLETPQSYAWAALLKSNCSPGSGRWLQYIGGATKRFRMEDAVFKVALRQRCMLTPSEAAQRAATLCQCALATQQHVTHLLDCKSNQWYYMHRHNTACELLAAYIRRIRPDVIIHREMSVWSMEEEEGGGDGREENEGDDGGGMGAGREDAVQEDEREDGTRGNETEDAARVERGSAALEEERGDGTHGSESREPTAELTREERNGREEGSEREIATPATTEGARAPADSVGATQGAPAAAADNRRSDLVCIFPHAKYTIDMSFVNPGCRKYIRRSRSHLVDGAAALEREHEKHVKYADVPGMADGGGGRFVPFAVEVTGRLGLAARRFIKDISSIEDTFHRSNFLSALSATCAMHLSMMVINKLRKLSELERIEF